MATRFAASAAERAAPFTVDTRIQPKLPPFLMICAGLVTFGWIALILGVLAVARMRAIPNLSDPPEAYLPGSPLPRETSCYMFSNEYWHRCSVDYEDNQVYFNFDADTRIITRTVIPAHQRKIGELVLLWGRPSGIMNAPNTTYVYWGTRTAHVFAGSIQPESSVTYIVYDAEQHSVSDWRGFRRRKS